MYLHPYALYILYRVFLLKRLKGNTQEVIIQKESLMYLRRFYRNESVEKS